MREGPTATPSYHMVRDGPWNSTQPKTNVS